MADARLQGLGTLFAISEELRVTGYKFDGVYRNGETKTDSYNLYFIEVKDKTEKLVGYYQAYIPADPNKKPKFRFYDVKSGEQQLRAG